MPRLHTLSLSIALVCVVATTTRADDDDGPPPVLSPVSEDRREWAEDLAKSLGLDLRTVQAVKQPPRPESDEDDARPGWSGLRLELDGLTIECRRCANAATADVLFGSHTDPAADVRTVIEVRDADMVLLRGRVLDDPAMAARALARAWAPRTRPNAPRAIGAMAPTNTGDPTQFAGFSFQPSGSFYVAGAGVLRKARENQSNLEERAASGVSWCFLDGGAQNHIVVSLPGGVVAEADLTPSTMFFSLGPSAAAQEREEAYLLAVLGAAGVTPPPPATGLVELIEPSPSGR